MVAGLKFLSKKAFNPQNLSNQKRVWEREQQAKEEARKLQERQAQLQRERDDEELALARGDSIKVNFLYQVPPGMEAGGAKESESTNGGEPNTDDGNLGGSANSILATVRQPGDDDAAAAFRALLAGQLIEETKQETKGMQQNDQDFSFALRGSDIDPMASRDQERKKTTDASVQLTALEKAAGRGGKRDALTLEEQIQRFPSLANAPRAKGISADNVGVSFKPLGAQIRNVRCLACGLWGHARGERECKKTGWNPFEVNRQQEADLAPVTKERQGPSKPSHQEDSESCESDSDSSHRRERQRKRKRESRRRRHHRSDSSDDSSRRHKKHKKKHRDDVKKRHRKSR